MCLADFIKTAMASYVGVLFTSILSLYLSSRQRRINLVTLKYTKNTILIYIRVYASH
jgi:hypothetical protein